MRRFAFLLLVLLAVGVLPAQSQVPSFTKAAQTFGDYTNARPAPTSGTLTGVYKTGKAWVQTGSITCNGCRLYFGGNVTINDTFTGTAGVENNAANTQSTYGSWADSSNYASLPGKAPGEGCPQIVAAGVANEPGGGGHGGAGGDGTGALTPRGGVPYALDGFIAGSPGGPLAISSNISSGSGGAGIYIEAIGTVTFAGTAVVHADGGNSGSTLGAGGSGGGIDVRSLRTVNVDSGAVISADGGDSKDGAGAGGGGIISFRHGPGSLTNTISGGATITAAHGTATGGGGSGSDGTVSTNGVYIGSRVGF